MISITTQAIINSLWVPPNSGSTDVRPWDANGLQTPRAHGDYVANTASSYGFMVAYNQFSWATPLRSLEQSGTTSAALGRKSGRPAGHPTRPTAWPTRKASRHRPVHRQRDAANSYYPILPGQHRERAPATARHGLLQAVQNICNNADGTPGTSAPAFTPNLG